MLVGILGIMDAPTVFAQGSVLEGLEVAGGERGAGFDTDNQNASTIIANLVNALIGVSGIIFLLIIVYAGFLYMTAGGVEDNVKKAKRMLGASVIGLVIVISSYAISFYVFEKLAEVTGETLTETSE